MTRLPFVLGLSLRMLGMTGTSRNGFAKLVTWVSFVGLSLGVMVLTVVVTVMNGFDAELKSRLLQSIPHITVDDPRATNALRARMFDSAALHGGRTLAVNEYFQGLGAVSTQGQVYPISLYGVNENALPGLGYLDAAMQTGVLTDLFAHADAIVMGAPLARHLNLSLGDQVLLVAIESSGESVSPKTYAARLSGTFELGAEPDYSLVFANLARFSHEQWSRYGTVGTQIQLTDPLQAERVARNVQAQLPDRVVESWHHAYGELFDAVALEKSMMFVLLLLVVAIAAFNIIAGQTMMVNDKRSNIAILRTMGMREGTMARVFLLQGFFISAVGTTLGLVLGVLCSLNINAILDALAAVTGLHLLDGSFFVTVPVRILLADLVVIALIAGGLSLLSSWLPAQRAGALDPVTNLHQ